MIRPVGVVLAGGAGRRMGEAKAGIAFRGETLAERAVRILDPLCERVLLSVAPGAASPVAGVRAVEDLPPPGRGPLAGLAAAFEAAGGAGLLVLACDYPFVTTSFLEGIATAPGDPEAELILPVDSQGRDHPLVALWRPGALRALTEALFLGEYAVRGVVGVLRVERLAAADFGRTEIDSLLRNWNTQAEMDADRAGA